MSAASRHRPRLAARMQLRITTTLQSMSTAGFAVAPKQIHTQSTTPGVCSLCASSMLTPRYGTCMLCYDGWRKKFKFGCVVSRARNPGVFVVPFSVKSYSGFFPLTHLALHTRLGDHHCARVLLRPTAFILLRHCWSFLSRSATALHIIRGPALVENFVAP